MGSGFEVDPARLTSLADQLGTSVDSMASARTAMASAGDGQTGEASLDKACGEFRDKWGYGLKQLGTTTHALAEGLSATAKAYLSVEDEVTRSFGGSLGGGGGAAAGVSGVRTEMFPAPDGSQGTALPPPPPPSGGGAGEGDGLGGGLGQGEGGAVGGLTDEEQARRVQEQRMREAEQNTSTPPPASPDGPGSGGSAGGTPVEQNPDRPDPRSRWGL
ncbi:hypothetical protein [Streptacidiphilus cavernicola]|uniref:WXG100 family type VII secretion target n=1 Tax=Streptacidiphilus cavernicola TaxID=3342716 RepID=A0ABV6W2P7_9ACTN